MLTLNPLVGVLLAAYVGLGLASAQRTVRQLLISAAKGR
jgi:hypothetical protein